MMTYFEDRLFSILQTNLHYLYIKFEIVVVKIKFPDYKIINFFKGYRSFFSFMSGDGEFKQFSEINLKCSSTDISDDRFSTAPL